MEQYLIQNGAGGSTELEQRSGSPDANKMKKEESQMDHLISRYPLPVLKTRLVLYESTRRNT